MKQSLPPQSRGAKLFTRRNHPKSREAKPSPPVAWSEALYATRLTAHCPLFSFSAFPKYPHALSRPGRSPRSNLATLHRRWPALSRSRYHALVLARSHLPPMPARGNIPPPSPRLARQPLLHAHRASHALRPPTLALAENRSHCQAAPPRRCLQSLAEKRPRLPFQDRRYQRLLPHLRPHGLPTGNRR